MSGGKSSGPVLAAIEAAAGEMVELMHGLTAIPAVGPASGGPGEAAKGRWLMERLAAWGFPAPQYYPAPCADVTGGERPNSVVRLKGASAD